MASALIFTVLCLVVFQSASLSNAQPPLSVTTSALFEKYAEVTLKIKFFFRCDGLCFAVSMTSQKKLGTTYSIILPVLFKLMLWRRQGNGYSIGCYVSNTSSQVGDHLNTKRTALQPSELAERISQKVEDLLLSSTRVVSVRAQQWLSASSFIIVHGQRMASHIEQVAEQGRYFASRTASPEDLAIDCFSIDAEQWVQYHYPVSFYGADAVRPRRLGFVEAQSNCD